jgi:hypothetical protein
VGCSLADAGLGDRGGTVPLTDPTRVGSTNKPRRSAFEYMQTSANHVDSQSRMSVRCGLDRLMQQSRPGRHRRAATSNPDRRIARRGDSAMTRSDTPAGTQRDGPDQDRPTGHRATASRTPAATVDHPAAHAERIDVDAFRAELRAGRDQWQRRWDQWQRHRDRWQRRAASRGLRMLIGCGLAGSVRFTVSDFGLTRSGSPNKR